jgi:peroxiredoxin
MNAHVDQDPIDPPDGGLRPADASELPIMAVQPRPSTPAEAFQIARDSDAPINRRLMTYSATMRALGSPVEGLTERLVERLRSAGAGLNAPRAGDSMPSFLLPDDAAHLVSLEDLLAKGPVAIAFHRGHWCPYCRINAHGLAQINDEAAAAGGQIVAITPERQQFAAQHKRDAAAPFRMLTDFGNGYAISLSLAIWLGEELKQYLTDRGRNLATFHGIDSWIVPIPATFVVGADGLIKARFIDPDYRKRMDYDELLAALRPAR